MGGNTFGPHFLAMNSTMWTYTFTARIHSEFSLNFTGCSYVIFNRKKIFYFLPVPSPQSLIIMLISITACAWFYFFLR